MLRISRRVKWAALALGPLGLGPWVIPLLAGAAQAAEPVKLSDVANIRQCGSNDPDTAIAGCTALI